MPLSAGSDVTDSKDATQSKSHVPGAFYHVNLRGNRQHIFFCPAERACLDELGDEVLALRGAIARLGAEVQ